MKQNIKNILKTFIPPSINIFNRELLHLKHTMTEISDREINALKPGFQFTPNDPHDPGASTPMSSKICFCLESTSPITGDLPGSSKHSITSSSSSSPCSV